MREKPVLYVATSLLFLSMIRIAVRNPTSSSISIQEIYELSVQAVAVLLLCYGLYTGALKFIWTRHALTWAIYGCWAVTSYFFAPGPLLACVKGIQLIVLVFSISIISTNVISRREFLNYLSWLTLLALVVIGLGQLGISGIHSIWKAYEVGNIQYDGTGRFRLSILSIYPLEIGTLTGAVILVILANQPKLKHFLAIIGLLVLDVLSDSRTSLVILSMILVVYGGLQVLRHQSNSDKRLLALMMLGSSIILTVIWLVMNIPSLVPKLVTNALPSDWTTLNGRIPLWHDVLLSDKFFSTLSFVIGHGFASFRYYGPTWFHWAGEAHNSEIQVWFETGLIGVTLWTIALVTALVWVWQRDQSLAENLIGILPIVFIIFMQQVTSNLADSRSFDFWILMLYSGTWKKSCQSEVPALLKSKSVNTKRVLHHRQLHV